MYKRSSASDRIGKREAELGRRPGRHRGDRDRRTGAHRRRDPGHPAGVPRAGALRRSAVNARGCYICKSDYTQVDAFYHQLCPACAAINHEQRDARTDLTGRRALLTGGRAKIGMYIALRLLRDGAHTTITTRFPADAVRRFAAMPDSADWLHRLKVVGIDLRDPAQVIALADTVAAHGPLDILINNAAQTVRRSPARTAARRAESAPLPDGSAARDDHLRPDQRRPPGRPGRHASQRTRTPRRDRRSRRPATASTSPRSPSTAGVRDAGAASPRGTAVDAGGLVPDLRTGQQLDPEVHEVDPLELLEVQLCNVTAPFILISRLRPAMRRPRPRAATTW